MSMIKSAMEKQAEALASKASEAAHKALTKIANAEDVSDSLVLAMTSVAYSNLAVLHKLEQIYEQNER